VTSLELCFFATGDARLSLVSVSDVEMKVSDSYLDELCNCFISVDIFSHDLDGYLDNIKLQPSLKH
jgi:hypothetical protein